MLDRFTTLLLDMNGTFMFNGDRFSQERDYSIVYHQLGGTLSAERVNRCGVLGLCEAASFSSDCGMVKPSPQPFQSVLDRMQVSPQDAVVIGDSVRRDLGGAIAAGIDCILVGGATHSSAIGCRSSLLELVDL
jgi:FMN phosphatase YigB (HAD superfamily)